MSAAIDKQPPQNATPNHLNSPEVDAKGKPQQRAITSAKQAYGIAKSLKDRAVAKGGRIDTAAEIARRYGAANPKSVHEQKRAGQSWSNNYSTNHLGSIIDRVGPQVAEPLKTAPLLVHSSLPDTYPEAAVKSRKFNTIITETISAWPEYIDFFDSIAQDVVLYGNAAPVRIDADWRPVLFRYDETYLPEGTGQHASKAQVAVYAQKMLIHDFLKLFEDAKIAEAAGYNIEGCVKIANATTGTAGAGGGKEPTPLELEDSFREQSAFGYSYTTDGQTKTVDLYHILVHDYTGEVDLWTVGQADGTEVRNIQGKEKCMDDVTTLFTMQKGNRKYYGSKGLGRLLTNISIAIELGRCTASDKCMLSGMPILEGQGATTALTQAKVRFPFIVLEEGQKLTDTSIEFNYEAFESMDQKLVAISEGIAGAFIPPNMDNQGSSRTKIEAAEKAKRDQKVQQGFLERFAKQGSQCLDMMKRAICSPLNLREGKRSFDENQKRKKAGIKVFAEKVFNLLLAAFGKPQAAEMEKISPVADPEAVGAIVRMMEAGLTVDEIALLAVTPSRRTNEEEGEQRDADTLNYIAQNKTSQHVDQKKAARMEAEIVVGADRADELLRPEPDQNNKAFAERNQTIEIGEMLDGNPMPVVGFDDHLLHRQFLAPQLEGVIQSISQNPTPPMVKAAALMTQHYAEHVAADMTTSPEAKAPEEALVKQYQGVIKKAEGALQRAAELQAQAAAAAPQPGQPPTPEQQQAALDKEQNDREHHRETLIATADVQLRQKEAEQRDRELSLKESEHAHKQQTDAATLQQKNLEIVAGAQNAAQDAELKEKQIDAQAEAKKAAAKDSAK